MGLADVDSDFAGDLVVRSGDSVRVGRYQDSTFGPLTAWGSLPATRTALFGDVDGDGAADMLGYDPPSGRVTLSSSTETSFEAPTSFGEFPTGHRLHLIDGDANGQADLAGEHILLGDLRVALTDMVMATGPRAEEWEPDPEVVYDNEDETQPANDPDVELEDPPVGVLAAASTPKRVPLRLGFQDERRLNRRFQIPDPSSTDPRQPYIDESAAYGSRAAEADGLLAQRIYAPLKAAGGDTDPKNPKPQHKPIMRFIVYWGQIENKPGTLVDGQPQRYCFDKLDRAIQGAEAAGFHVYLTLSGATDFECNRAYNPNMRACASGPTGIDPVPQEFGDFAAAVAGRYKGRATAYGIWNEPNNGTFLRAGREGRHNPVHVLYRKLYLAAYNRIKRSGDDDDAVGYSRARVYIGELSHLTRSVRVSPTSRERKSLSALRFLRDVAEPHPDSQTLIRTQGVAWHPYQHTGQPDKRGSNGVVGIGRANEIQDLLDKLARHTGENGEGPRLLVTPKAKRPVLFFTEFGYFNGPYPPGRPRKENPDCPGNNCGTQYYKTEAARADYYRRALRRAYFQDARWMVIYQATEISPQNYADQQNDRNPPPVPPATPQRSYNPEYGLFSATGEVTGIRTYGKGPDEDPAKNKQTRTAFCAIYDWTAVRDYGVGADPCETGG